MTPIKKTQQKGYIMTLNVYEKKEQVPITESAMKQIVQQINEGKKMVIINIEGKPRAIREWAIVDINPDESYNKYIVENEMVLGKEARVLALKIIEWGDRIGKPMDGEMIIKKYGLARTQNAWQRACDTYDGDQAVHVFWDKLKSHTEKLESVAMIEEGRGEKVHPYK